LANLFFNFASQRISVRLKQTYFDAVTAQEIGYFDIKKTGELINALSDDVNRVVEAFGSTLMNFSMFSGQIVGGFILGMIQVYQMVLLGLCSLPITLFVNIIGTKLLDYFTKRISRELATSVATANEVISSIKTVRSMAGEEKEKKRYERELRIVRHTGILQALSQGLTIGTSSFFVSRTWIKTNN
jgi:ATP-binding cassette subfamily B (MDR/TAP) protein 1